MEKLIFVYIVLSNKLNEVFILILKNWRCVWKGLYSIWDYVWTSRKGNNWISAGYKCQKIVLNLPIRKIFQFPAIIATSKFWQERKSQDFFYISGMNETSRMRKLWKRKNELDQLSKCGWFEQTDWGNMINCYT